MMEEDKPLIRQGQESLTGFPGQLLYLLSENPDIQTFMDKGTELLGNPLLVVDIHFRILYASQNIKLDIPLWNVSLSEHFVSEGIISSMEKNAVISQLRSGKDKTFLSDLPNGYKALRTPLFYRGNCCGFLGTYDYLRPFGYEDDSSLLALARALSVLYNADPNILGALDNSQDGYLLELLKCENRDMAEILTRRNSSICFGPDKLLICLTRRMEGMAAQSVAFSRLKEFLQQGIYSHISTVYNHHLVMLFSMQKTTGITRELILDALEENCEKYNLYAGLSYPFEEDAFIPLAYKQALKASLYADPADGKRRRICRYEDYMLSDIMNASLRVHPASLYEHPILTRLIAYDREYGTQYLDTLRLYLRSFGNMKITAAELGVHYNTIKYRISMIEEIGGQEIRYDPELLLRLTVSLRILDFAEEYDKEVKRRKKN